MIVNINGTDYQLNANGSPFSYNNGVLTLFITNNSTDAIVEACGEKATVTIPNEYMGKDLALDYVKRSFDKGNSVVEVVFKKYPIEETLKDQAGDIEMLSQAIIELAEIIAGGDEEEPEEEVEEIEDPVEEVIDEPAEEVNEGGEE